ncbi:MAG: O-methyltransferase [Actinobacteria bacterium]|nr:O-methyltransferase [Actinomycetota bacterium]
MSEDRYATVDRYLEDLFAPADPALAGALERSNEAGLPAISVSSAHGRLLHVLALACHATRILEIGTLGGYSTIWLARAVPRGGRLLTLEREAAYAQVARRNLADAGVADRVEVRVGDARDTLAQLQRDGAGPFDLVFIDADKPPYAEYLAAVLHLSAPGTLIVADNVVRDGRVAQDAVDDEAVAGVQRFNAAVAAEPRVAAAIIQQVGVKGYDGMAFAVVR